ncbi:MAG: VOC family protein [Actinomycetota bacterium]|nr:VOC family protein [Actinomycetota bacterium]
MIDRLSAHLDHVAVAVPDWETAQRRWRDQLGGGIVAWGDSGVFASRQLRFANGAKLELLRPDSEEPDNFVRRFLGRFGSATHHVTFKVADLDAALKVVRAGDLDVVDVDTSGSVWHEGFLRPSEVGGLVVQLAWSGHSDQEWAASIGHTPEPPALGAAELLGPTLRHPDLDRARTVWTLLGASISHQDGALHCRWPDSPLDVVIERGRPAGPTALRMRGTPSLPAVDGIGPAVTGS